MIAVKSMVSPSQIGRMGSTLTVAGLAHPQLFMVIIMVAFSAHWSALGVNVYVIVPGVEVSIGPFQVPVMLFEDVVGNTSGVSSTQ